MLLLTNYKWLMHNFFFHSCFIQEKAEIYLLAIFVVEAGLKIVTRGFILHPDAYLRNAWNILDFIVVVTGSVISTCFLLCLFWGSYEVYVLTLFSIGEYNEFLSLFKTPVTPASRMHEFLKRVKIWFLYWA